MKIFKWISFIILGIIGLFLIIWTSLQFSGVQNFIVGKITSSLTTKLQVPVKIKKVDINFFKTVVLEGIYIEDKRKDTLLYAGKLKTSLGLFSLANSTIELSNIELQDAYVNIYQREKDTAVNYQFILDAFASDTTVKDTTGSWGFDIGGIALNNVRVNYYDFPNYTDVTLAVKELSVDMNSLGLTKSYTDIDNVYLDGLRLKFNQIAGKVEVDTIQKNTVDTTVIKKDPWRISLEDIEINQSFIVYNNENLKPVDEGIDFNHLNVTSLTLQASDIDILGSNLKGEIKKLCFKENNNFTLDNLAIKASLQNSKLDVELNEFKTPESHLDNTITVSIANITQIAESIGDISAAAEFEGDIISMKDIIPFVPTLQPYKQLYLTINGNLKGKVGDLQFTNADLSLNENNYLRGDFNIKGLPEVNKLAFEIDVKKLNIQGPYIGNFIPEKDIPVNLVALGNINSAITAIGNIHNFKTTSRIVTGAGTLGHNLHVLLDQKLLPSNITGQVYTNNVALGRIIDNPALGALTMNAKLQSKGKSNNTIDAVINSFGFNNYLYSGITLKGNYINNVADINIAATDTNLFVDLKAFANMNVTPFNYGIKGNIRADLHKLNLYATPLRTNTYIDANAIGKEIDSLKANLLLADILIRNDSVEYTLDTLTAFLNSTENLKVLGIKSDLINADIRGKFKFEELSDASQHLLSHYMTAFKPNSKPVHLDSLKFKIDIEDTKGITNIFMNGLGSVSNVNISGDFEESSHILNLNGKIGELEFQDKKVNDIRLNIKGDKEKLDLAFNSQTLRINPSARFYNPSIKGTFKKDVLSFNVDMSDTSRSTSSLDLNGILSLRNDSIKLSLPKMELFLRGHHWELGKRAEIVSANKFLKIYDFLLTSKSQKISVQTQNEKSNLPLLNVDFLNVSLGDFTEVLGLDYKLKGLLNGEAEISDLMGTMGIAANIKIDSIAADNKQIGNFSLSASKPRKAEKLNLTASLSGGTNNLKIDGDYYMTRTTDNLDFNVNIVNLNTATIQPFLKDIFYTLTGNLTADLKLKGSPSDPQLTGDVNFKESHVIGVTALQTQYRLKDEKISFNKNSIELNDFSLLDTANQKASINGFVYHNKLQDYKLDLDFDASNFRFLDSRSSTTAAYSGTFIADVNAKADGPLENLNIRLKVKTKPETNVYLNLATHKQLSGIPEFISFVEFTNDSSGFNKVIHDSSATEAPKIDMSRFNIKGTITMTDDAAINIIINPETGDNIYARGNGTFRLNFDSNNDINLFGEYVIEEGNYSLNVMGVINRQFAIEKGSTINLYGNPEAGEMKITAIYTTRTPTFPLISDMEEVLTDMQISTSKTRQPVNLHLNLEGEFLKPKISFKIKVPDGLNRNSAVDERINQIAADETALNKQVFGLLALGKFIPYQGGSSESGGSMDESVASTVGGLISDQLNKLGAEYLDGVEIEVNSEATTINNQVQNNVSVMANKEINDRLKVGVGGKTNVSNNGNTGGVTGEYNLMYQVNKSGTLNLKLFSTGQQNIYTGTNTQISGFSLNHSRNFNSFRDLFKKESVDN